MLYLFAAELAWILAALAVGFVVGWLTTTRNNSEFSGGWVVIAFFLLLGAGFALSSSGAFAGRSALTFDIGLLLATAYVAGLPLGGGAKLLAPAAAPEAPAKRPKIVVVRGEAPDAQPAAEAAAAPAATPAAAEHAPIVIPSRRGNGASRPPAGAKPMGLAAPRGGAPDDLSKIKGVGPKSREKLHALGVFHYDQIAAWSPEEAKWIGAALGVPGRVERGAWVAQAKALAGEKERPRIE